MKNLNEELHKLGRYEYTVSEDFSQKVMKRIQKDKFSTKVKQVIPFASLTVAACLVVMICTKTGVSDKMNMFSFSQEFGSGEFSKEQGDVYMTSEAVNQLQESEIRKEWLEENDWEANDLMNDVQSGTQNKAQDEVQSAVPNSSSTLDNIKDVERIDNGLGTQVGGVDALNTDNPVSISSEAMNQKKQETILSTLKQAGYQVEVIEDGVKIKAKKEAIQNLLGEEFDLEEQGEWVILKF